MRIRCWSGIVLLAVGLLTAAGCSRSPERVVLEFMTTTALRERLPLVADPESVRAAMEEHHANGIKPKNDVRVELLSADDEAPARVRASWSVTDHGGAVREESTVFFVVNDGDTNKIDWAATVGFNEVRLGFMTTGIPAGRFRYRGRVTAATNQPELLRQVDRQMELPPKHARRSDTSTAYRLQGPEPSSMSKPPVIVGRGSALDDELHALTANGTASIALDLHVSEGALVVDRVAAPTWVIPRTAPTVEAVPSPLHRARPDPDISKWVLARDGDDLALLNAAAFALGDGRSLLVPCDGVDPTWARHAITFTGQTPSGCAPRAVSLRHVTYLPPDEVVIAHVDVAVLESGATTSSGAPVAPPAMLHAAAIYDEERVSEMKAKAELMDTKAKAIVADRSSFRGKTFVTSMCCGDVMLATYVAAGPFVELNRYVGQKHEMTCFLEWKLEDPYDAGLTPDVASGSSVEVRVPSDLAKRLAADDTTTPLHEGVGCKRQVSGSFTFAGQVSWLGWPVFYLTALHPPRPPLAGSGTGWSAKVASEM